jgi:hypothetical protein
LDISTAIDLGMGVLWVGLEILAHARCGGICP